MKVQPIAMNLEKNFNLHHPYYAGELLTRSVRQKLHEPGDLGRLGKSPIHIGMRKMRVKHPLGAYIVDFFNKATIHGLNHLAAPQRHFSERILALLFIGSALTCLVVLGLFSWDRYQNDATGILLNHDYRNFNVTKPGVTVCPLKKIDDAKFARVFAKFGVADTPDARYFFTHIANATYETMDRTPLYASTPADKWLQILAELYPDIPEERCLSDPRCKTDSKVDIVTERGFCTVFSDVIGDYLTANYLLSNDTQILPLRSMNFYTFYNRVDRYVVNKVPGKYEISVHHPASLALVDSFWYTVENYKLFELNVIIHQIDSSIELENLSVGQRKCKFLSDGGLESWPIYTTGMCTLECRYEFIKMKCNCYPHFARPKHEADICNATQLRCIGKLSKILINLADENGPICSCLPDCEATRYLQSSLRETPLQTDPSSPTSLEDGSIIIDITFPYLKLQRAVFFGFNEFLVSVGGAAGLFLGASIISFVEILYYATLRIFWYKVNLRQHAKTR